MIPSTVRAQISVRIVPDQKMEEIVQSLQSHLENAFATLQSPNKLQVKIEHTADWWLGNLEDPYFQALENAVREEWGTEPLRIREGGVCFSCWLRWSLTLTVLSEVYSLGAVA